MRFNEHSHLVGQHAFLAPSYYHWTNYTPERLRERWVTAKAALLGIEQHIYAKEAIENREVQVNESDTLGLYINDAISFRMIPEQVLYFSENCFGMADAISFRYRKLRVFDLKTGVTKASIQQLMIYAALFCMEYGKSPYGIKFELRIYQDDEVRIYDDVDPEEIFVIMHKIVEFDAILTQLRLEEEVP